METGITKKIGRVEFGVLSPSEIRKMSATKVITADTYDDDGFPIPMGLMDPRLGVIEPGLRCKTCGLRAGKDGCPGHFGHIDLAMPVIHVGFVKEIRDCLRTTCRNCGRILLPDERLEFYKGLREEYIKEGKDTSYILKAIINEVKNVEKCPRCGREVGKIEIDKPTTFRENGKKLTPSEVREWLEKIPDEDLPLLDIERKAARPEWFVLTVLPVPPVTVRPSVTLETGERSEDDLTHKLVDIIRINQRLQENRDAGAPQLIVEDLWELLQYHVTTYLDNQTSGIPPARHRSGRPLKTLAQRLKGKEGRFRSNLSGKRVNFSARTVISPDPNLSINEVGVPVDMARELTVPIKVTEHNIEWCKMMVRRGPNPTTERGEYIPGVNYVIRERGGIRQRIRVTEKNKEDLAEKLEEGMIIERQLIDGDIVLFNRQPSLHRMSMMGHKVRIVPYKTFRFNLAVCPPYNADFDGDEMNLHVLQGEEARAEAEILLKVQEHILSPRFGGPIIGAIHDHISGCFLLTYGDKKIPLSDASRIISNVPDKERLPKIHTDENGRKFVYGKDIFSCILPKELTMSFPAKICSHPPLDDPRKCPTKTCVIIEKGILKQGVIDENAIGAFKGIIIDRIVRLKGIDAARKFIDQVTRLGISSISTFGFTVGVDEEDIPVEAQRKIEEGIEKAKEKINQLIEIYRKGELEPLPGRSLEETLEMEIMRVTGRARDMAGEIASKYLGLNNSSVIMAKSGARGSMLNLSQMAGCIGQQAVRGERIHRGYRGRTLPHFKVGDIGAEAKGFVSSNYKKGLSPTEYFFHSMGGREGLVDTAVRTSRSGYMQRRLINALENLKVDEDLSVRDTDGLIIQFIYGEDGVDPTRSARGKAVDFDKIITEVKGGGIMAKKNMTEEEILKKIKDYAKGKNYFLPPSVQREMVECIIKEELFDKIEEFVDKTFEEYRKNMIDPAEACGIVAAQSIGEPGTQMTMRTFHYAGVAEINVTLGLPRLIEIVDARSTPSTPMMTVYLEGAYKVNAEMAQKIANQIEMTRLQDIADLRLDVENILIYVDLDEKSMSRRDIRKEDIVDKIKKIKKIKVEENEQGLKVIPEEPSYKGLLILAENLRKLKIKGIDGIERVIIRKEEGEGYVIYTEGSNLEEVLQIEGVDSKRTRTNDILSVARVLGIEAARNMIIEEAYNTLMEQGLHVDIRHIMLVADIMTADGTIKAIGRHGVSGEKSSVLSRAAFEITVNHLLRAARKGEVDELKGVAENIIVGQPITVGTGAIKLVMGRKKE